MSSAEKPRDSLRETTKTVREAISDVIDLFKKTYRDVRVILGIDDKPLEIPESWKIPSEGREEMDDMEDVPAVAHKPIFVFNPPQKGFSIVGLTWEIRIKRLVAFFSLIVCVVSVYTYGRINPLSLVFYIPSAALYIDYMKKLQSKKSTTWYILKDIEQDD